MTKIAVKKTKSKTSAANKADVATPPPFKFNIEDSAKGMHQSILNHLRFSKARDTATATQRDWWECVCLAVRDRIMDRFIKTMETHNEENTRRVYYLSLEYLMGRLLSNNLHNAGLWEEGKAAMNELSAEFGLDFDLDSLCEEEPDMGLGNGGLGRLAACFLDSLATLDYPAIGYGIFYEFGLFRQEFEGGRQVEHPDDWLQCPNPWPIARPEYTIEVKLYGHVEMHFDKDGDFRPVWVSNKAILGLPRDIPICGYGARTVNFLRLWESRASQEFDLDIFNQGSYTDAVREKAEGETISKVLYPNDTSENGKELRLVQQYFFVACSLRDIVRRFLKKNSDWETFPEKVAIQLNDTHPAVAVPELMRLLIDEEGLKWDYAWGLCRKVFGYTNHTLLPEALERWSVPLFERVLPRHLQIIFEINRRFLEEEVDKKWPGDGDMKARLSIIEEGETQMIRMAYLSVVASHSVNGVAALHSALLKARLFPEFDELYTGKFNNKTNGITPRRWLEACNPGLSELINDTIGKGWPADLERLRELEKHADDKKFQARFMQIKHDNKKNLAAVIKELCHVEVSPDAIFDVQIKRLHEYKRQHLNLLHILYLYRRLLHDSSFDIHPRVFIFAAKAAPGYWLAKRIIHAINAVGERINNDERINGKLKIAFLPNYSVSLAEKIIPSADISEQISTAGKEASGTGNMKLSLNGALTVGTLDGANVEIKEEVGEDNIFIFGNTVEEIDALRNSGYNPYDYYYADEDLRAIVDWLGSDYFTPGEPQVLKAVRDSLLDHGDPFFVLADFAEYCKAQARADAAYRDKSDWARMAILNTARMGKFSSDRTINEYARDVWNIKPLPVD